MGEGETLTSRREDFIYRMASLLSQSGKLIHRHRFDGQMIAQMNLFRGDFFPMIEINSFERSSDRQNDVDG